MGTITGALITACILSLSTDVTAQVLSSTTPATGRPGSISGRVLEQHTDRPVIGVQVSATPQAPVASNVRPRRLETRTDETGRYVFPAVPAGRFRMSASFGRPGGPFSDALHRVVTVGASETVAGVDLVMTPSPVVTGRVTDDRGGPAANIWVQLIGVRHQARGTLMFRTGAPTRTDRDGRYRLAAPIPGTYIVAADVVDRRSPSVEQPAHESRTEVVPTYAPGAASIDEATVVQLDPGATTEVDVRLAMGTVASLTGRVVDSLDRPIAKAHLILHDPAISGSSTGGISTASDGEGRFVFASVPRGQYVLSVTTAFLERGASGDTSSGAETARVSVEVDGESSRYLLVMTTPASVLSGSIVVHGDRSRLDGSYLRIAGYAIADDDGVPMMSPRGTVTPDLDVRVTHLVGQNVLRLDGLPPGWIVRAVRVNGEDATYGYDYGSGRVISGLEIVIDDKAARIEGTVRDTRGQPTSAYALLLFVDDDAESGAASVSRLRSALPDQHGRFALDAVRPGNYRAIAIPLRAIGDPYLDPADRPGLRARGKAVRVAAGEQLSLNLELVRP